MQIAVVGAGRIGALHAGLLAEHPDVGRITVSDVVAEAADSVAARLGPTVTPDIAAVADVAAAIAEADAVVITSATSAHAELIQAAAAAGRPVFCEKPIALDLDTTRTVLAAVARSGTILQMGFQRRFDPGHVEARRLVTSGKIGRLYVVRMLTHDPAPPHEEYIALSGGLYRDLHIHEFDSVRWVTGQEVVEVYADGAVLHDQVFAEHGDIDTAVLTMRLSDGTLGLLSGTRHDPLGYDVRLELFGSADSVVVGWDAHTPMRSLEAGVAGPESPYPNFQARFRDAYRSELFAFLDVARGRIANPCGGEEALAALRIAEAAVRSQREHRPVALTEIPT